MTATRTRTSDIARVVTTPLPEAVEVVSVAVVHRSRQHRSALAAVVAEADDLDLVVEVDAGEEAAARLAEAMPDVAIVELDAVGLDGVAELVAALPVVALIVVADDDGPALGDAVLGGAVSAAVTAGGHRHFAGIARAAHPRRAFLTPAAAARLVEVLDATPGAGLELGESEALRDLASGRSVEDVAASGDVAVSDLAARVARATARLRLAAV